VAQKSKLLTQYNSLLFWATLYYRLTVYFSDIEAFGSASVYTMLCDVICDVIEQDAQLSQRDRSAGCVIVLMMIKDDLFSNYMWKIL